MRVLFEKVLWQVAQANSQTGKQTGNKRMEDILRKREAMAGRLTLGLIGAITISSMAFAGYAIQGGVARSDFPMAVPSLGSAASNGEGRIIFRTRDQDPAVTGSVPQASRDKIQPQQEYAAVEASDRNSGRGYVVRKILRRGALVEGPSGIQEVSPGSSLPGAGRVISIFKSDGGWVVVTSETVIREGAMLGLGTASSAQRGAS